MNDNKPSTVRNDINIPERKLEMSSDYNRGEILIIGSRIDFFRYLSGFTIEANQTVPPRHFPF